LTISEYLLQDDYLLLCWKDVIKHLLIIPFIYMTRNEEKYYMEDAKSFGVRNIGS